MSCRTFMRRYCQGVDVATLWFSRNVLLSFALFDWAAVARCMLVSVFGAAILISDPIFKASAMLMIHSGIRSHRTRHGKTVKWLIFHQLRCFQITLVKRIINGFIFPYVMHHHGQFPGHGYHGFAFGDLSAPGGNA